MQEDKTDPIHSENVETAPDDSEDEHLTEEQALAQAKEQGIEFKDQFQIEGFTKLYDSKEEAVAVAPKGSNIIQIRSRVT